jgi:tetratricopeptide (TPR) repeat protein
MTVGEHPVLRAMISSTTVDLPEHREEAKDACLRQDFFPLMMEHLPSDPAAGLAISLRMVDEADVYILMLGARYGFIPVGSEISITHAEYARAIARGIPVVAFLASDTHPFALASVETGAGAEKLDAFRREVEGRHTVSYFRSAHELGKLIVDTIAGYRKSSTGSFHFVSDICSPPEAYVAHPYVLLDSADVVGRQEELDLLTDWASGATGELAAVRILSVVAIGGMGKSALTWKWFSEMAAEEMRPLAGRMWWSFYESDATFENFVVRALAYVRRMPREEALAIPTAEREQRLLEALNTEPFLICMDGLERIIVAYARSDAANMPEDDLDEDAENFIRAMPGAPEYAIESMGTRKRMRRTTDPRAGAFLRKLSRVRASRILISTRLYPADLQATTGVELSGCKAVFLGGLKDHDAVALWRALGVRGRRDALLNVFRSVENYPLLIRVLAGEVAHFRPAPGDFDAWLEEHPAFDPFSLPLVLRKTHILQFSLRALSHSSRQVLITLAAFRMPAAYSILAALFLGEGGTFERPSDLHQALADLEDRGLAGWDRRANRYDLHPIVRGAVWHGLSSMGREIVLENLHEHLTTLPTIGQLHPASVDDLTPAIELYHTLIALGRNDEAYEHYRQNLYEILVTRMNRFRTSSQLLESLFPDGIEHPPRLSKRKDQHSATWALGYCYIYVGESGRALTVWPQLIESSSQKTKASALNNYAYCLSAAGRLAEAEEIFEQCVALHEQHPLYPAQVGGLMSYRGKYEAADGWLFKAMTVFNSESRFRIPSDFTPISQMFWHAERQQKRDEMRKLARRAIALAATTDMVQIRIDAFELLGWSLMEDQLYRQAEDAFSTALAHASEIGSKSEVSIAVCIAELYRRQGALDRAREVLADLWEPLQRGPLRLLHAKACNLLAEIELSSDRPAEAASAAATAYRLAWCDGPPYCLIREVDRARDVLARSGASVPAGPPED